MNYQQTSETQPLNSHREKARKRVRMRKMLPAVGIAAVVLMMIAAALVVLVSSGYTFRRPLSETDPDLYYSHLANEALVENLTSRKTKKPVRPGCEATVILMRHCERYFARRDREKNEYCGYLGLERAHYLATLFGDGARWPAPSRLYAMDPIRPGSDNMKFWQADTLEPLAEKIKVMVKCQCFNQINMKCFNCDSDLIIGGNHSYEDCGYEGEGMVTNCCCNKEFKPCETKKCTVDNLHPNWKNQELIDE